MIRFSENFRIPTAGFLATAVAFGPARIAFGLTSAVYLSFSVDHISQSGILKVLPSYFPQLLPGSLIFTSCAGVSLITLFLLLLNTTKGKGKPISQR